MPLDSRPGFIFKTKRLIDRLIEGREITDYFHRRPISPERASELIQKYNQGKSTVNELSLLGEFERSKVYDRYKSNIPALVLASGFDGIPGYVFGSNHVTMSSLEPSHYFDSYLQWVKSTEAVAKVGGDMFHPPFAKHSFSTLILHGFDVFDQKSLGEFVQPNDSLIGDDIVGDFFQLARDLVKPSGKFIISSDRQIHHLQITSEMQSKLADLGWKVDSVQDLPVLKSRVLTAI